ncbi:outer membrane protein transport protein [Winogradskyella echinorum]|uniref:Outer membrane protein transport protein n=1 Tax=Winogradskyella echinorum TaxID=538189 RepID=A0ABR6Y3N2_9FLAO|nr:outer membrane protein transport protein [Winogradskyella echinorum]MBC3847359.1 outer membrane protein transport protein [Winogradskyella echinorum]MBC5751707.1 outer membrane protein transport protein [Winogradskyella echinorum]
MKKLLMLCIGLISTSYILAQDVTDAVRYSMDEIQGTARFRAMSGAFGALGGDLSSVNINPAGSAIFNDSRATVSIGSFNINNDINYLNNINSSSNSTLDLNQLGATFVFRNTDINSPWKKFTLSAAYDRVADFNDEWVARGTNNNSIDSYFLGITNNLEIPFGILKLQQGEFIEEAYMDIGNIPNDGYNIQQAFLGYWSGIIDPENLDDNTNNDETNYVSNISPGNFNQDYLYSATGYNGKLAFNLATEYDDKLFLGVNLNTHFINYEKFSRLNETNSNNGSIVNNVTFDNILTTNGSGFSFQLGAIAKLTPELRAGVSYNSPTWYRISEELIQGINSNNADPDINYISDVVNLYPEYKLQTPGKITGSLAYVFGSKGLLSFDYTVKDYSSVKFRTTTNINFSNLNTDISDSLTSASTYRFGGEYRYKQLSFRGGYRFEESPYKDDNAFGDLTAYSLGLGYSFGNFNLDLAFSQSERDMNYQLYTIGLTDSARIESKFTDVILSLTFNI